MAVISVEFSEKFHKVKLTKPYKKAHPSKEDIKQERTQLSREVPGEIRDASFQGITNKTVKGVEKYLTRILKEKKFDIGSKSNKKESRVELIAKKKKIFQQIVVTVIIKEEKEKGSRRRRKKKR